MSTDTQSTVAEQLDELRFRRKQIQRAICALERLAETAKGADKSDRRVA